MQKNEAWGHCEGDGENGRDHFLEEPHKDMMLRGIKYND